MPKVVDHEQRRQELVEAAWRVIARVGIDGVTIREIANESGYSTGTLAHYFADKDDILRVALERADDNIRQRLDAMPTGLAPVEALYRILAEALPLDEGRRFELTLDVNFWARALNRPSLRSLQHGDHDDWRARVLQAVQAVQAVHEPAAALDAGQLTDILVACVDGLGLHGLIYPEYMTAERITALLDLQIRTTLAVEGRPDPGDPPSTVPDPPSFHRGRRR